MTAVWLGVWRRGRRPDREPAERRSPSPAAQRGLLQPMIRHPSSAFVIVDVDVIVDPERRG
jgi:hypothetical protein